MRTPELGSDELSQVLRSTPCPYAGVAAVATYIHRPLNEGEDVGWSRYLEQAVAFVSALPDAIDVAAIEVPILATGRPERLLARAVHTVIGGISCHLAGSPNGLYNGIESDGWELKLLGRDFFPLVVSPGYPLNHPRHILWRQPVLLLQPEDSFTRHGISSDKVDRSHVSRLAEE